MVTQQYIPLRHFEIGQSYKQIFLVGAFRCTDKMVTNKGIKFARVTIQDTTGFLEGILWNPTRPLNPGDFVEMEIYVYVYAGKTEFKTSNQKIEQILSEEPDNLYDYIKGKSQAELESYATELDDYSSMLQDPDYNELLGNVLNGLVLAGVLRNATYGTKGPLVYPGGLLVHVVHSLRFARIAAKQCRENEMTFNVDLIVAGCILRSVGWSVVTEFCGNVLNPLDAYHMTGVREASMKYINDALATLSLCIPENKRQALVNLCRPIDDIRTIEGKIVAQAEQMADLLDYATDTLDSQSQFENWTPDMDGFFIGHLARGEK